MKKLTLLTILLLNGGFLFAQNSAVITRVVYGTSMSSSSDIIENISRLKELSTLVHLIDTTRIAQTFKANGPITVFAPNNQAFINLSKAALDTLLKPAHKQDLIKLLLNHAVAGKITSKDLSKQISFNNGQAILTTMAGSKLIASIDANRNIVLTDENGNKSIISRFDIQQKNGVLDVVTAVLIPKNTQP